MFVHGIKLLLLLLVQLSQIRDGLVLHASSIPTIEMKYFIKLNTKNVIENYFDVSSKIFKLKEENTQQKKI